MKTIPFGKSGLQVPAIALGCMRLTALDEQGAQRYVRTALDLGANFFDHADIYGGGACEELFGKLLNVGVTQHYGIVDGNVQAELQDLAMMMNFEFERV